MKDFTYDERTALRWGRLFPRNLEIDPFVLFHGTCSEFATIIERDGFIPQSTLTLSEIERINEVYRFLRWAGNDMGGFAVLSTFSKSDFMYSKNALFFGEIGLRSLMYATHDFAGGEKLRAVRKAVVDLQKYHSDPSVREEHAKYLRHQRSTLMRLNAHENEIQKYEIKENALDFLDRELEQINPIFQKAMRPFDQFQHGVVYAIRLSVDDVKHFTYKNAAECTRPIGPEKIIARMMIPKGVEKTVAMRFAQTRLHLRKTTARGFERNFRR